MAKKKKKKKKKKKRKKKPKIVQLRNKADKVFSIYIRERDKGLANGLCLICQKNPIQCTFHIVRRGRKVVRWDERNAVGTCHRCNYVEYRYPDISRAWYIKTFGVEEYLQLVEDSLVDFEPTAEFLEEVIKTYEQ